MFEESLKSDLKNIFQMNKATFDRPGESREQGCIFIDVEKSRSMIKDSIEIYRVDGKIKIFAPSDKIKFGFFNKKIKQADHDITSAFFFGSEESLENYQNIVERSLSFVYFYSGQYDPDQGTIDSVNLEFSEDE